MKAASLAAHWLRLSFVSVSIALSLSLVSCGGGTAPIQGETSVTTTQVLMAATGVPAASVITVTKVSETRVSRTVYDYVFKVTVQNGSLAQTGVTATLLSVGAGTTIVDGTVVVGDMQALAITTPTDTITLRQDRTFAFSTTSLNWSIEGTPDLNSAAVSVDPDGGTVDVPSGKIRLIIPAGALPAARTIVVTSASPKIQDSSIGNFAVVIEPEGIAFSQPVTIIMRYDPIDLPVGVVETDQQIVYRTGDGWTAVATVVDTTNKTLTATTTHFSTWGISSTTTPAFQSTSGPIPYAKWQIQNGCLQKNAPEMVPIEALSKAIFHWSTPPDPDKPTQAGCVTEPYLAKGYSKDTYKWDMSNPPIGLENHAGIDFRAPINTPAYAVANGIVKVMGVDATQSKSTLIIESTIGATTYWIFYLHCNSHSVTIGQPVAKGDQVCLTGAVGAFDPHLHFEVKIKGIDVDSNGTDYLKAMGGSHCPNSKFMAYNGASKGFTLERYGCTEANLMARTVDPVVLVPVSADPPPPPNFPTSCKGQSTVMGGWTRFGTATYNEATNTYSVGDTIVNDPNDSDGDCNAPASWTPGGANTQDNDFLVYNRSTTGDIDFSAEACISHSPVSGHTIGLLTVDPAFTGLPGSGHQPFIAQMATFNTQWNRPGQLYYTVGSVVVPITISNAVLSAKGYCGTYRMTRVGNLYSVYFNNNFLASAVGSTAAIVPAVIAYDNVVEMKPTVIFPN